MDAKRWSAKFDQGDADEGLRLMVKTPWFESSLVLIPLANGKLAVTLDLSPE